MISTSGGTLVASVVLVAGFWGLARRAAARRGIALQSAAIVPVAVAAGASVAACALGRPHGVAFIAAIAGASVSATTDAETGCIFDDVSVATLAIVLVASLLNGSAAVAVVGALAACTLLGILHVITRGGGLGLGDVKLGASIGACLGPLDGIVSLGLAFILGGTYGSVLVASRRRGRRSIVRFGPFLAAGLICEGLHPCFR